MYHRRTISNLACRRIRSPNSLLIVEAKKFHRHYYHLVIIIRNQGKVAWRYFHLFLNLFSFFFSFVQWQICETWITHLRVFSKCWQHLDLKKKKKNAKYCPIDVYREVLIMSNYLLLLNYVTRVQWIFSVLVRLQIEVQKHKHQLLCSLKHEMDSFTNLRYFPLTI